MSTRTTRPTLPFGRRTCCRSVAAPPCTAPAALRDPETGRVYCEACGRALESVRREAGEPCPMVPLAPVLELVG